MVPLLVEKGVPMLLDLMEKHDLVVCCSYMDFGREYSINQNLRHEIADELSSWKPQHSILKNKILLPPGTIGFHIRKTDQIRAIQHTPLILYFYLIKEELRRNPESYFFICTDDPQVLGIISKKFKQCRFLFYLHEKCERSSLEGMTNGFLDFVTLADCERIYGCKYSSFSELAASYGKKLFLKVSTRKAPDDYTSANSFFDYFLWWDEKNGCHLRHHFPHLKYFQSLFAKYLFYWMLSDFYQMGFWHRLKLQKVEQVQRGQF